MFLSCVIERVVRMRFRCQNKSWIYNATRNEYYARKKKLRRLQKSQQIFFKIDTLELERYCQANFASNMWGQCPWVIKLVNKQIRCLLSSQQQGRCVVQFPTLHKKIVKNWNHLCQKITRSLIISWRPISSLQTVHFV